MAIVYVIIYGPVRALTQFRLKIEKIVYEYKTVICLLSSEVDIFEHFIRVGDTWLETDRLPTSSVIIFASDMRENPAVSKYWFLWWSPATKIYFEVLSTAYISR